MAKVIRIRRQGEPSVMQVEDFELPPLERGEARVHQEVIGVNYVDTMVRDGRFQVPLPSILGFEAAGTVEAVGPGVSNVKPGDRVGYFFNAGAYASERNINAAGLIVLPDDISTLKAGSLLAKGLTAWMGLRSLHQIAPGETILIQGASGAVGAILSRWAKAMSANVIGVYGAASKLEKVQAGTNTAISTNDPDFAQKVRDVAPDGVDVVYDLVGDATAGQTVASVREGGEIITIGAASGQPRFDATELAKKRIRVIGGSTPQHVNANTIAEASAELFEAMRAGIFDDLALERFDFADVRKVHEAIAARSIQGLPVLTV